MEPRQPGCVLRVLAGRLRRPSARVRRAAPHCAIRRIGVPSGCDATLPGGSLPPERHDRPFNGCRSRVSLSVTTTSSPHSSGGSGRQLSGCALITGASGRHRRGRNRSGHSTNHRAVTAACRPATRRSRGRPSVRGDPPHPLRPCPTDLTWVHGPSRPQSSPHGAARSPRSERRQHAGRAPVTEPAVGCSVHLACPSVSVSV